MDSGSHDPTLESSCTQPTSKPLRSSFWPLPFCWPRAVAAPCSTYLSTWSTRVRSTARPNRPCAARALARPGVVTRRARAGLGTGRAHAARWVRRASTAWPPASKHAIRQPTRAKRTRASSVGLGHAPDAAWATRASWEATRPRAGQAGRRAFRAQPSATCASLRSVRPRLRLRRPADLEAATRAARGRRAWSERRRWLVEPAAPSAPPARPGRRARRRARAAESARSQHAARPIARRAVAMGWATASPATSARGAGTEALRARFARRSSLARISNA